jgi:hypothetical protein
MGGSELLRRKGQHGIHWAHREVPLEIPPNGMFGMSLAITAQGRHNYVIRDTYESCVTAYANCQLRNHRCALAKKSFSLSFLVSCSALL